MNQVRVFRCILFFIRDVLSEKMQWISLIRFSTIVNAYTVDLMECSNRHTCVDEFSESILPQYNLGVVPWGHNKPQLSIYGNMYIYESWNIDIYKYKFETMSVACFVFIIL